MQSKLSVIALLLATTALAIAAFTAPRDVAAPSRSDGRVRDLQRQVAQLSRTVEELRARLPEEPGSEPSSLDSESRPLDTLPGSLGDLGKATSTQPDDRLKAMVDDAVAKKAKEVVDELAIKENKKPSMDVFASMLELSKDQRYATEQEVIRGQRETYRILETPTQDGSNLMDELIEVVSRGFAWPGRDHGWGKWITRVTTMKVPGSNETYSAQIEAVKASVRDSFKRTFSKEQYSEFEGWGVDPIEIKDIAGSPGKALEKRVIERIKQLGEQFPDGPLK
ncbi:MAG: hypothetical protein ACYSX0_21530 [Planctomycetota bacterium]|jgi:hypothetical protein